ncbi:MAG: inosine/xanthosine triphosphatase [Candidatus Micrarchaeota archaeon]|nr:inosine/xanthosine triphosphatase [Candidatus Micrarchaeota archaeon]
MNINIASRNPVKVNAVKETIKDYELLRGARVRSMDVGSGVSEQPRSIEDTVQGAVNRATKSFKDCKYSIGIESGLMSVPQTKTGSMDFCACAIYDGSRHHIGLSCAFELPTAITKMVHELNMDVGEASVRSGLTQKLGIGSSEGTIGILTKERVTRKDQTVQAIRMALIHLENPGLY